MAEEIVRQFGRIDVLINNAAVFSTLSYKPFSEKGVKEWDNVMAVNVRGIFLSCKAVAATMKEQKKGKIINISSGTAFKGRDNFLHYVTSKAAVLGLTRGLARELGPYGITVNSFTPGHIMTEAHIIDDKEQQLMIAGQAIKRLETPRDVVGTIIFLSSDASDFITGQTIAVNGGSFMH